MQEKMSVTTGKNKKIPKDQKQRDINEEKRLQEMMIPKKKKKLYSKMIYGEKRKTREANILRDKRKAIDTEDKQIAKKAKRSTKK